MDPAFMREALQLARKGRALASPNPMVGAVLERDGSVVGRGFHTYAALQHAEIVALEQAGPQARGATLYVNLEPCAHQGRTPPCVNALIEAGVARVVAAIRTPIRWWRARVSKSSARRAWKWSCSRNSQPRRRNSTNRFCTACGRAGRW